MRRRSMVANAMTLDPSLTLQICKRDRQADTVVEEIEGLIRVYKDGRVDRPQIVPNVTCALSPDLGVASRDIVIDKITNTWARFYVPLPKSHNHNSKLPLIIYFHGGGFCVGSPAWSCYHEFLSRLAENGNCLIMSASYRLAPENRLPAAYEDGVKAVVWVRQKALRVGGADDNEWWTRRCDFSRIFLGGDSAGANIAYNVFKRLSSSSFGDASAMLIRGMVLVQPFFGGEARTQSEKFTAQSPRSALSLAASDAYWRLSLPPGANRDHPWCNPVGAGAGPVEEGRMPPVMVSSSEMDILKDRNVEVARDLGRRVTQVVYKGVGHAFQVLGKSQISQTRTLEMIFHIKAFINEV